MKPGTIEALKVFTGSKTDNGVWSHSLCDGEHHITYSFVSQFDANGNFVGGSGEFSDIKKCDGGCKTPRILPGGYPFGNGNPEAWIKSSLMEKVFLARLGMGRAAK